MEILQAFLDCPDLDAREDYWLLCETHTLSLLFPQGRVRVPRGGRGTGHPGHPVNRDTMLICPVMVARASIT